MNEPLHIIVDTREQRPWAFPRGLVQVKRGTLLSGDYALSGDHNFTIERKSLADFVGSVTSGWQRLTNEFERMDEAKFPAKILILEGTFGDILNESYEHSKVRPKLVIKKIAMLSLMGVAVLFTNNAHEAAGLALGIFREREKQLTEDIL